MVFSCQRMQKSQMMSAKRLDLCRSEVSRPPLTSSMILPYIIENQWVNTGTALFIITPFKQSVSYLIEKNREKEEVLSGRTQRFGQ